jgi:acetolactate synthase small subunit
MNGDVMPGCMGTAMLATGPNDLSRCTCSVRNKDLVENMAKEIKRLSTRIKALEFRAAQ